MSDEVFNKDEILDIFHDMADAIRGNRQIRPNPRTERFIDKKMAELCGILGRSKTRRQIEERIAQHLQNGAMHGDGGEIIGWRTCDCHACTSIGRSPRGPDFRYDEAWDKRGSL